MADAIAPDGYTICTDYDVIRPLLASGILIYRTAEPDSGWYLTKEGRLAMPMDLFRLDQHISDLESLLENLEEA